MAEAQVAPAQLTEVELERAVRFAREALRRRYGMPASGSPALPLVEFDKVNITIRRAGRLRASMSGRGASLQRAIEAAVEKCARDDRFGGPLVAGEVEDSVVELWVQVGSEPLDGRELMLGVDGVEIRLDGHYAYYKPSVPLTSDLGTAAEVLEKLCGKADLPPDAWRDPAASVRRTQWLHVVDSPDGGSRVLRRLRSPHAPALDRASIEEAACAAARRLAAGQNGDGAFLYRYDPLKDQAQPGRFSSVRHAGCAYSLAWLGSWLDEEAGGTFTWSAARALALLFHNARALPEDDTAMYLAEGNGRQGRLGTSALALLALQFEPLREIFAEHRAGLRRTLLTLQNAAGWFEPAIDRESPKESNQDYYPGEALAALGHELSCGGDGAIAAAFKRAFPYYRDYFRRQPTTAFILWQADAWRLFDEHGSGSAEHAAFVFEMTDWLLQFQYTEGDFAGGFPRPSTPRYSSACYTEAIVRACSVALRHGDRARAERYREAARAGLRFVGRLQAGPESAFLFPRPELAVGGVTANLSTFTMRSDFDQHAITAYLAALEVQGILDE
jgi:hypothetical protein